MRNRTCHADLGFLVLIATIATPLVVPREASGTAQFSRQYNTSCSTCHSAFPRLNDVGIAFKDAGFQFREEDLSFILSPLGVAERPRRHPDQRSLLFATFNCETVLEATGNYDAVYLRDGMDANERARQTFEDVLLPSDPTDAADYAGPRSAFDQDVPPSAGIRSTAVLHF